MTIFKCEILPYDKVIGNEKRFNTRNYLFEPLARRLADRLDLAQYENPVGSDKEYNEILAGSSVTLWSKLLPMYDQIFSVRLSSGDVKVLYEAAKVGLHSGRRPIIFEEELQPIEDRIAKEMKERNMNQPEFKGYFVRTNEVSPKDGCNGPGPYFSAKDVINVLVTSRRFMVNVEKRNGENLSDLLHFYPWNPEIHVKDEWRVFVYKGRVTAISQYCWFEPGKYQNQTELIELAKEIECFHANLVSEARLKSVQLQESYVMDVCAKPGSDGKWKVIFIELNVFGCQSAAGSCTFEWCSDFEILYGVSNEPEIVIRVVGPSNT